jgi:hypothetical protein
LAPRRTQPEGTPRDLSTEKAHAALSTQLEGLQLLRGRNYREANPAEHEWFQLTEKLVARSFGSGSMNYENFSQARSAGFHSVARFGSGIPHARNQNNYEARLKAYEAALRSCLAELQLDYA